MKEIHYCTCKLNGGAFISGAKGCGMTNIDGVSEIIDDCHDAGSTKVEINVSDGKLEILSHQKDVDLIASDESADVIIAHGPKGEPVFRSGKGVSHHHIALAYSFAALTKPGEKNTVRLYITPTAGNPWVIEWPFDFTNPEEHKTTDYTWRMVDESDDKRYLTGFCYTADNIILSSKDIHALKTRLGDRFVKDQDNFKIVVNRDNLFDGYRNWDRLYKDYGGAVNYTEMKIEGICTMRFAEMGNIQDIDDCKKCEQDKPSSGIGRKKDMMSHQSSTCSIYLRGNKICDVSHESIVGNNGWQHFYDGLRSEIDFWDEDLLNEAFIGGGKKTGGRLELFKMANNGNADAEEVVSAYKERLDAYSGRYAKKGTEIKEDCKATEMAKALGVTVDNEPVKKVVVCICSDRLQAVFERGVIKFFCPKEYSKMVLSLIYGFYRNNYTADIQQYFYDFTYQTKIINKNKHTL